MAERFMGFPREALTFFRDLARHNNRDWFLAHKDVYEGACLEPMKALVAELDLQYGPSKIFRIYRDVRFSSDKSPYKTNIAAVVGHSYIHLDAEGLYVGTGMYRPDTPRLRRFRDSVADDKSGRALATLLGSLKRKGYEVGTHETLSSAPRGYAADHPRLDLLRMKDIFAGRMFPPATWLATRAAITRIKKVMTDVKPLNDWLRCYVR